MEKKSFYMLALALILCGGILFPPPGITGDPPPPQQKAGSLETRTIAYYFHGNYRCPSCKRLEEWSKKALYEKFPEQVKTGELVWTPVNVDEKENKHFIKDFKLYTKSLVLVRMNGASMGKWKNLNKVWSHLKNQNNFYAYVEKETADFMKTN